MLKEYKNFKKEYFVDNKRLDISVKLRLDISPIKKYMSFVVEEMHLARVEEAYFDGNEILDHLNNFCMRMIQDKNKKSTKILLLNKMINFFSWCIEKRKSISDNTKRKNNVEKMIKECNLWKSRLREDKLNEVGKKKYIEKKKKKYNCVKKKKNYI